MTADQEAIEPVSKKYKIDDTDLKTFVVDETLNIRNREKVIIVKGKFNDSSDNSILIFEKSPFPEHISNLQNSISQDDFEIKTIMTNDIYKTQHINGMPSLNTVKLTVIKPASEKHIQKYRKPRFHYVRETPSIYASVTKPFTDKNNFSIKWIDNILNNKAEEDRVLIKKEETENGFLLALDYKWDGKTMDDIHCLAITSDYNLQSLRDLNGKHLSLLKEIMIKSKEAISSKFGIPKSQLRLYFHYPPSFYHLHVHITNIHDDSGALVDRAYPLSPVIQNIELNNDYYQKVTLDVLVNENDPLFELFKSENCIE